MWEHRVVRVLACSLVVLLTVGVAVLVSAIARRDGPTDRAGGRSGAPASAATGATDSRPGHAAGAQQPRTVVSLTFNDGKVSQYRYARPLLRQHRMAATYYVSSKALDEARSCCITWQQAEELYRAGDEIGGATLDHVDLTRPLSADPPEDLREKRRQVCDDRRRLAARGLDPRSFAYPAGAARHAFPDGSTPADLVRSCGYLTGRIVGGLSAQDAPAETLPPAQPYAVRTPAETSLGEIRLADLQAAVTAASGSGGWLPLAVDEVCRAGDAHFDACMATRRPVRDTVLSAFLSWIAAAGTPDGAPAGTAVRTVREAVGAPPPPPLPTPATYVSLTFDDADRTQYRARQPLRERGMHATFFANTGLTDARNPAAMTWTQLHELARDGHEIGGHTLHHVDLTDPALPADRRRHEVCADRERLAREGLDPVSFAYPFGGVDEAAKQVVRSCGYRTARTAGSLSPGGPVVAEKVPPGDPLATFALDSPAGPLRAEDLRRAVTAAARSGGGWVQIVLHRLCHRSDPDFATCMAGASPLEYSAFVDFLTWLDRDAPAGTTVRSVREVVGKARP